MNWLTIKNFGRVKYFNVSYLALIVIPIYIDYSTKINEALEVTLVNIPISIRLIYLASLCYAFGIALYQYCCPKTIKDYDKVQDYIRDNFEIYKTAYPDLKLNIVLTNLTAQQENTRTAIEQLSNQLEVANFSDKPGIKADLDRKIELLLPSCIQTYLTNDFNAGLRKNSFWMFLSLLFYFGGTGILITLLVQKSITVFNF